MPTLTSPNVYEYIVEFENNTDNTIKFRNTLSFFSPTVPTGSDAIISAMNDFFQRFVHSDMTLLQGSCYNWTRGGPSPYPSGLPIFVLPINLIGTADGNWGYSGTEVALGGEVCLRAKKTNGGGSKPGRLFHRGLLRTIDVDALSGGKWAINTPSAFVSPTKYATTMVNSTLSQYVGANPAPPQYLVDVPYSKKHGTNGSPVKVHDIVFDGATTNKISRKNRR